MSHGVVVVTQLRRLPRQGVPGVQLPDPGALVAAALPLRPGAALRVEVPVAAGARQPGRDGASCCGSAQGGAAVKTPYARKRYWNEPDDGRGGSAPTCSRSCAGWRSPAASSCATCGAGCTRPQGRAHHLLPRRNARRLRAAQPRQARADAAPRRQAAVHRVQPVRDRVPGQGDRDRGRFDPDDPAHPKYPAALRDRLLALHLLRAVRRGLPRGRDPHGQGSAGPARARPPSHVARRWTSCCTGSRSATSPSPIPPPAPHRSGARR